MIVRTYCDNGYKYDEDSIDIELNDIQDIESGALEIPHAQYNLAPYLTESGIQKIENYYPNFPWKSCYHGVRMITERQLIEEAKRKEIHDMVVEANRKAHLEGKLAIGEFYGYEDLPITSELLIKKGWNKHIDQIYTKLSDEDKKQMDSEGIRYDWDEYTFTAINKNHDINKGFWFLTFRYDLSNTLNRDWSVHIDNNLHESVACVDIGTIRHFNKLMDLMDIEYRL